MLNSLNALSDETSLLSVGLFSNPILLIAISISILLHCGICYIPFFGDIFGNFELK
jgi:Ca2+-transporting ATPase